MATINCQNCGKTHEAARASAKYCSDKCRVEASRGKKPVHPDPKMKAFAEMGTVPPVENHIRDIPKMVLPPRLKNHSDLLARMNERLEAKGLPSITADLPPTEFIRTGIQEIDELTVAYDPAGWGGIPRRHITEVFGTKGAGKTSLMKKIIKQNEDLNVLYFDVENGLTNPPESTHVSKATLLENIEGITVEAVDLGAYDLIIIDSVAMMSSRREKEADKAAMMEKAKAMAAFVRRLNAYLRDDNKDDLTGGTAVVFINQLRDTGNSFGIKEFTPGGRSLEYGASLRLELRSAKADKIIKAGATIGQRVRVKIEKSRFNGEDVGTVVTFPLRFSEL